MKKAFVFALAMLSALAILSGCGKKNGTDTDETSKPSVTTARDGFEDVTDPPESPAETPTADETTENVSDTADDTAAAFTTTDAVAAARAWMGDVDEDTGFKYSYSFDEMLYDGGKEFYKVRVSWYLEEEERYSLCGYLLVSADGTVSLTTD